jgi:predicted metal-dependent phosphoesterase TrpH
MRLDLQTHTRRSPRCGWLRPERLVERAMAVGLDGVAITDHNTTAAVDAARAAAPDELLVVPGIEVDTTAGQLIGLFVDDDIEPGQSPDAVIDAIRGQNGLVVAPHPFDALRDRFTAMAEYADRLDAVETVNSRCVRADYNDRARAFAARHDLPAVGGSDAHFAHEVGTAYTALDDGAPTADAVRTAIREGRVTAQGERGSLVSHAGTKLVKTYNRLR